MHEEEMEGYVGEAIDPREAEEHELEVAERLHIFASRLNRLVSEQVAKRSQIEQRWLDDIRQYHGEYASEEVTRLARAKGSEIFVNITRNKTNAAEARLQDMLFPTDDRNFGIYATPVPELDFISQQQPENEEDANTVEMARQINSKANDAAIAMQDVIDDQLLESRYHIKARDIIHDACQLGTAILKGPVIIGRTKKRWDIMPDGMSVMQVVEALEPTVERIDPWDFYPDMSAKTISEAEFVFERRRLSKKQLRDMARLPGVLVSQLREIVKEGAQSSHIAKDFTDDIRNITGINTVGEGNKYEVFEYHGPISKSELIDAMRMSDDGESYEDEEIDELDDEVEATVFFSGNRVIKVALNPMDSDERPFSVFNWEKDESSIFGFGVPCLMRSAQKVINASWRMMMDNAGLSVADQLVVNKELLYPADGSWNMTPKKIWYLKDKTRSVQEAFASFATPSHQVELANIFSMARQLADEETNLPLIAQGEMGQHTTKTSSGMAMLMNSSNIVLRKAVKNWDDDITRPLITRFYDWNMQFSERPDVKGDFSIEARGSGALLVREKQQENLMIYSNLSMSVPEFAKRRDWAELDREIAKSLELPYDQITLDDQEIAEMEEEQQAMQEQMMQMQQMQMQSGGGADQMKAELAQVELQLKSQKLQLDAQKAKAGIEQDQAEMMMRGQIEEAKLMLESRKLELEERIQLAQLKNKYQMSNDQLQTKIAIDSEKIRTDRDKAAATTNVRLTDAQLRSRNISNGFDTFG